MNYLSVLRLSTLSVIASLFAAQISSASLITANPGTQSIYGVNVMLSANTTAADGSVKTLQLLGDGLRSKKVALIWIKVYVAQLLAETPANFNRDPALASDSITKSGTVAIQLSFLRNVDAPTVQNSFREAFSANNIDMTDTDIAKFLSVVNNGGDAFSGTTMTIRGTILADGKEEIAYEDSSGKMTSIMGSTGFVKKVFAIWLGEPSDGGLATLKAALLTPPATR